MLLQIALRFQPFQEDERRFCSFSLLPQARLSALFLYHCKPRFCLLGGHCEFVFSSLSLSLRGCLFVLFPLSLRARSFACEAVPFPVVLRPLRRFAPRSDRRGGVAARSSFRLRSSLDRQESLRASFFALFLCHCEVVFSLPKQSQRFLAASRLGMTDEECPCEVVVSFPKQSHLLRSCRRCSTNSTTSLAIATACSAASFVYTRAGIFSASPLG